MKIGETLPTGYTLRPPRFVGAVTPMVMRWRRPAWLTRWLAQRIPRLRRVLSENRPARSDEVRVGAYLVAPGVYELTHVEVYPDAAMEQVCFVQKKEDGCP